MNTPQPQQQETAAPGSTVMQNESSSPMTDAREQLKAKMAGACAALEERKLDANPYPEDSELRFCWLYGWTEAKLEMQAQAQPPTATPERKTKEQI